MPVPGSVVADAPYPADERGVFQYFNGTSMVWGDPLEIEDKLEEALDGESASVLAACQPPTATPGVPAAPEQPADKLARLQAQSRLMAAVRIAFAMTPFDPATGQGARKEHCSEALWSYYRYLEKNASRPAGSPTPARPSASMSSGVLSPTQSTSASC